MPEQARLQIYTTEDVNEKVEQRADQADLSKSKYCEMVLKKHHGMELRGRLARHSADEDIIATIDDAADDISTSIEEVQVEATPDLEHIQSLETMYVIALWELLKEDYSPAEREAAIKRAALQMNDAAADASAIAQTDDEEQLSPLDPLLASDS
ncbi:hypothetical protein KTS45_19375 [Halomicroarcula limicola]|uniref:Uncharacterized protein n=1 Tax=Haloarcula limicola TaxID=1429915 RepID=A0A8J7YD95_9EURY|nr:hypothetical protein [Halomicroarcula limicola]MBV0926373.1 hypothetical protein [Halomicroarcula limicola]